MKWLRKFSMGNAVAMLTLLVATVSANSACMAWLYQDEEDEAIKKLRKF